MTWQEDFAAHAQAEAPRECCGLLCNGTYVAVENVSEDPRKFRMSRHRPLEFEAICHSHVYASPWLSDEDKANQWASQVPWHLYHVPTQTLHSFPPARPALVGREFSFGTNDCYGLARDYYADLGILLPNPHREDGFWRRGEDPFTSNFKAYGFERVQDLREGDAILMHIHSLVPNHVAIYLGDNRILHHAQNRLSSIETYGPYYRKVTRMYLRHRESK